MRSRKTGLRKTLTFLFKPLYVGDLQRHYRRPARKNHAIAALFVAC